MSDVEVAIKAEKGWIERHPKLVLLLVNILILVMAEVALRLLARNGVLRVVQYSTTSPTEFFMGDINKDFGVWHHPNKSVTHSSPCFSVEYVSNSYGARDRERSKSSTAKERVVVLGDSFVEGYGVNIPERMTEIAEQKSGVEFLNFGVSGNFGSVQAWLLYEKLASQFDHSTVAIFFLPANDFEDNDPNRFPKNRYRPYLIEDSNGNFKVEYTVKFEDREQPKPLGTGRFIRRTLYNNVHLLNHWKQFGQKFEQSEFKNDIEEIAESGIVIPYEAFTPLDLKRLLYSYERIIELARGKAVTIYIVPTKEDLLSYQQHKKPFQLVVELENFASRFPNVKIVDLLPVFVSYAEQKKLDYDEFTHKCDSHWSLLGNQIVADQLASNS